MKYIIYIIMLSLYLQAISLAQIKTKIEKLRKIKENNFTEIKVKYDPFCKIEKIIKFKKNRTIFQKTAKKNYLFLLAVLNKRAFINHKWYKNGDIINRYKIIHIYDNHVVLKKGNKIMILKIKHRNKILNIQEKQI